MNRFRSVLVRLVTIREGGLVLIILGFAGILSLTSGSAVIPQPVPPGADVISDAGSDGTVLVRDRITGREWRHRLTRRVNKFLQPGNLDKLVKNTSFFAIMAVGATLVIITGGIDLSIGSVYCLAAVSGAMFLNYFGPTGPGASAHPVLVTAAGILLCIGIGAAAGLVNGLLITSLGIHPFIVTLGTMAIYRGIAFIMSRAQAYTFFPIQFTDGLIRLQAGPNIYPVPMFIMLAVAVAGTVFLGRMVLGRYVFAVGGNETAARFSGIGVERVKLAVYTLLGVTCGIAAMIMLGYYGSASSDAGKGYELDVIAAAVVGGASLQGGRGSALGALLGALLIQLINNSIVILGIDQNYSQVIIGAVIIAAVFADRAGSGFRAR